jgi:hypothetical protein
VAGSNVAPGGRPTADSVTLLAGTSSGSPALTVNCNRVCSSTLRPPIGASTGAAFTSRTVIVTASESARRGVPSSVAVNVTTY